ncbi:MAG: hypothetical protein ABSE59_05430 [Opitutaceae bacterium]|jgi:hypothetical protein
MPADTASNSRREISNPKVPNAKKYLQIKIFNPEIYLEFGIWRLGFAHLNAPGSVYICVIRDQIELQNIE